MADLLKPDAQLAELQAKAEKATGNELAKINEQINARQLAIMKENKSKNIGFGSRGSFFPTETAVGTEILNPTGIPGVYSKTVVGTDKSVNPYGIASVGDTSTFREFYDENGNLIDKAQVAGTELGRALVSKGWDIGYGTGSLGPDTSESDSGFLLDGGSTTAKSLIGNGSPAITNPLDTTMADSKRADRVSAYNTLYNEFDKYGLGTLVSDIKNYLVDNTFDPSEFSIQLKNTAAYQKRFAANADRIKAGLSALKPAEYIALEDQYQSLMRNYGLPDTYSAKGDLGIQEGFNKLIANDVSATELEDRITTAQYRVVNADPNVLKMLKAYYPDITNGDILAYTLDPKNAIDMIKRKVTAAEIGGTQYGAGLNSDLMGAEALAKAGVTQGQYAQAAPFISQATERGTQLADIYGQGTYNQGSAEAEALNLSGGAQAAAKRKKLTSLETAAFSGSSGVGALGRDKSLYGAMQGQAGLY